MGIYYHIIIVSILLRLLIVYSAEPQDSADVVCTEPGASDCVTGSTSRIPYSSCCSMPNASQRLYLFRNTCRICGPIFDLNETLPTASVGTLLIFSWALSPLSIPASNFSIASRESGSDLAFGRTVLSTTLSNSFLFEPRVLGREFTFLLRANGINGGVSPDMMFPWTIGRSLAPTLDDFREISASEMSVEAEWIMRFNGICPLLNMTLSWRASNENSNSSNRVIEVNGPLPDDSSFNSTFENLSPGTQYILEISASNSRHTSITRFVFGTTPLQQTQPPVSVGLGSAIITIPTISVYLPLLFITLPYQT